MEIEESRAFLGLDVGPAKFTVDSDDESSSDEIIGHHNIYIQQEQSLVANNKRKGSPSLIQGNYVCVKRKLLQPSMSCRSVN